MLSSRWFNKRRWPFWLAVAAALAACTGIVVFVFSKRESAEHAFKLRVAPPSSDAEVDLALYQTLGARLTPEHTVRLLLNGGVFDSMVERIGQAKSSIHILMYIWEAGAASDRVVKAIVAKARAGVGCRILVDDVGSPDFSETVAPPLRQAGCDIRVFRPLSGPNKTARNHRKLLVIDGSSAITGGFGVRDNWLGDGVQADSWRDTNVLFTGAAVTDAQQAFAENWQEAGGPLLPAAAFPTVTTGGGSAHAAFIVSSRAVVTRAERLMQLLIASAHRRLWIANAYFVPSRAILDLLMKRAEAGVDVRILAPYKNSDSKTAFGAQHLEFGDLLKKGVKIWEYDNSMMHAKTVLVDDRLALVGSINLDPLSLNELEEGALLVRDPTFASELERSFVADCARAKRAE